MKLYWKKINENAIIPQRQTACSAGADLCACIDGDIVIKPGEIVKIKTGVAVEPEFSECVLLVFARSGLSTKNGINLANGVGVVDSDYRGEIIVPLMNNGIDNFVVKNGMRVAQIVCMPVFMTENIEKTDLSDTERGEKGFGSTGL